MNCADAVARIAGTLVKEALWDGERATWFGDEIVPDASGGGTPVYRAVGGDLYGGTAGIALFLARYAAVADDDAAARTARAALAHAVTWVDRTRPDGSLLSGAAGVAAAALDLAHLLGDEHHALQAARLMRVAVRHMPAAVDLVAGRAGSLLALLHLARGLPEADDRALAAASADAAAAGLIAQSRPGPVTGRCWPSDAAPDGPALCGLAHGASGVALALLEWGPADPRALRIAEEAAAFERSWFSEEQGTWADLRDLTPEGGDVAWPSLWCHGAVGVGAARLRHYDLTGREVYAAEAGAAVDAALRLHASMVRHPSALDLSICHGLAGAVELLLDAAAVFGQPVLRMMAGEAVEIALDLVGEGEWPCGVPGGGENPSLFLGLAGIGSALLRVVDARVPSTILAYAGGAVSARVIVQLTGPPGNLRERVEAVRGAVPGARVERVSPRGRILLRLPAGADVQAALTVLGGSDGVDYAELDTADTAQEP
ncbi:Lanthionine synthetase C-like protein [Sinosporangium album]|uniref:Lanthionine synthetase C-like protein n=1 Tax=Sinosporangium album TaxID=504805 RepID=A0A1G8GBY1_9ACTN|nr:lanthionine synthetase LanC family protein [Sinosporangium album]SDH91874.1 Lanthionine synthetase C-like protein [Sinosporangium album]